MPVRIRDLPRALPEGGQIVRFVMVGGANTLIFSACYLPLHRALPYFAAYTVGFLAGMTCSFFLNTYFTYRTRPTWRKFLLFPLTQVTSYACQSMGLVVLVTWCGVNSKVAPLAAALPAIPFTFLVARRMLLPGRESGQASPPPRPRDPA
ncbi:GtrA family protein [Streptomyces chattanoogensis]|uniref:GtrA family protein n=1 Tax=Streptomyces chattanoogensis TaxID=66876 RepID=UPI0036A071A6